MSITVGIAVTTGNLCQNASKLPQHFRESPRVTIVQGESSDLETLRSFVGGCDVIICCYLGDNNFMVEGQRLLVDACELENIGRYVASDYCLDFTKLALGQHPAKDPMKHVKAYLDGKKNAEYPKEIKFSFYGDGDEIWESITYETAAEYVTVVALDRNAVEMQHFLSNRKSIKEIAKEFSQVFYQFYCINGQTYLKKYLDNKKYPQVTPVTFRGFLEGVGYMLSMGGTSKIIYDKSSGQRHICEFKLLSLFDELQSGGLIITTSYTDSSDAPRADFIGKERRPTRQIRSKISTPGRSEYGNNHSGIQCEVSTIEIEVYSKGYNILIEKLG
ncbi:nmrA-like family protein [Penicillium hordei]|uniref:NmrA-like family protein n=1 Tax=Penicillium hordei TaxID=40994 RepID=A0AAD6H9Q9_9EURO|nr:nmrA-like family protein [Penicillium hordei]KAJ5618169.1 nmrA-like family protein [Penicillium hordei]